ncbi:MAG: sulfatase-like hydrolase/transferase, partial [Candidatus Aminicenantes bacterium]|nr:sulfatase-like hydrolase/transferase [Candidatus Aminicenantes bacterium]
GITKEGQTWVGWNTIADSSDTLGAKVLKEAGYATGIVGKLHCLSIPESRKYEFDGKLSPEDPKNKEIFIKQQEVLARGAKEFGFDFGAALTSGNLNRKQMHNPEYQTKCCIDFINKNKSRPFYLYFAPHIMHMPNPLVALKSADTRNVYGVMLDEASDVQPSRTSVLERVREAGINEMLAPITWLDDSVGALVRTLKELGIADSTLIILAQDNGHHFGKGSNYEGGIDILGCWMHWPDGIVNPGRINEALIENIDFMPTIFEACGVIPGDDYIMDGKSLVPILRGERENVRDSLMCEIGHTRAVVTKKWKYLALRVPSSHELDEALKARYMELAKDDPSLDPLGRVTHIHSLLGGTPGERVNGIKHHPHYFDRDQLYDLENDPEEQINLAKESKYASVLADMKNLLKEHMHRAPGTFAEFKTFEGLPPKERAEWMGLAGRSKWKGVRSDTESLRTAKKRSRELSRKQDEMKKIFDIK